MTIPYTTERREDTGVNNVTLGIWLFLASEVMLFGALFSAYALLRVSASSWPHGPDVLNWRLGLVNTAILLLATLGFWRARRVAAGGWRAGVAVSLVGALTFLFLKTGEYRGEIAHGFVPSISTFAAMYFTLTGLHALHVLGGAIANAWILAGARRVGESMTAGRLHAVSLYWAFVDLVWLLILGLLYLS